MGGGISKLSELAIKAFAKKATPGTKLADGGGLHLFITPAGFATWRVKYRAAGKPPVPDYLSGVLFEQMMTGS